MKLTNKAKLFLALAGATTSLFGSACSSSDNSKTDDGGSAGAPSTSSSGPQCDAPGTSTCTGSASGLTCPAGSTDAVTFTCATGEVCEDGACVGQCKPGATECVGDGAQRICTADGRAWVTLPCATGDVCEGKACKLPGGLVCIPGAKECDGSGKAKTCKGDGSGWESLTCPGDSECTDGQCVGSVCVVGDTRCDESTFDIPNSIYFETSSSPSFNVLQRCVDGSGWVTEPCPADADANLGFCSYDKGDAAAAARYRAEVALWTSVYFGSGCSADTCPLPTPPTIPAGAQASCHPSDCNFPEVFFETAAQTRWCGTTDGADTKTWAHVSQCDGIWPYTQVVINTQECSGLTACGTASPQSGCQPTTCLPDGGESICWDSQTVGFCDFNASYPQNSSFDFTFECPDAGACTDSGKAPKRAAKCDGVIFEEPTPT